MTAYRGRRGRAPLILKHGCSWRWLVNTTLRSLLTSGEIPGTHWIVGWVGLQIQSGHFGEEENLIPLPRFESQTVSEKKSYVDNVLFSKLSLKFYISCPSVLKIIYVNDISYSKTLWTVYQESSK
jgi:hypothetical protein